MGVNSGQVIRVFIRKTAFLLVFFGLTCWIFKSLVFTNFAIKGREYRGTTGKKKQKQAGLL